MLWAVWFGLAFLLVVLALGSWHVVREGLALSVRQSASPSRTTCQLPSANTTSRNASPTQTAQSMRRC